MIPLVMKNNSMIPLVMKNNGVLQKFRESDKSLNHKFKYSVPYMCLSGTVVATWSLMQEVGGLSQFFKVNFFVTEFAGKKIREKSNILRSLFIWRIFELKKGQLFSGK